jgi:lipid-A-disaccharide synthase
MRDLLVVAGEASGDRAAACVLHALGTAAHATERGAGAFGLGGAAMAATGAELVSDLRASTAMGIGDVARRACAIRLAYARIVRAVQQRRPRAALLVNYTEFNTRLAARLHAQGVRVLWYGAPQIWAWRPGRADVLRRNVDRMAVMLPFEEAMWRTRGIDAHYVGHPASETNLLDRTAARELLGLTPFAKAVAILPGSRPHEVTRLLVPMLEAYERVRKDRASIDGRVLLAPSLDAATRAWAVAQAEAWDVESVEVDARVGAAPCLSAFDVALCASGTAALEAALARAIPIVAYQVDLLTELAARLMLTSKHVALPNVILGRTAFAELLQRDVRPRRIAEALAQALDGRPSLVGACDEVERALGGHRAPSREVARMLRPWLDAQA